MTSASRLLPVAALLAVLALFITGSAPSLVTAADHLDAPGLNSPAGLAGADINDLYLFEGQDPSNTVMAMTAVPLAAPGSAFGDDIVYKFNVDTDGDAVADAAYKAVFSTVRADGSQYMQVLRAEVAAPDASGTLVAYGQVGNALTMTGGGTAWAGPSSDPFFFDLGGFLGSVEGMGPRMFLDGMESDFFLGLDVMGIVIEVPDGDLGGNIGVWASTAQDGVQLDRLGRPAINTVFNASVFGGPGDEKNVYNAASPDGDVAGYHDLFSDRLVAFTTLLGMPYTAGEADGIMDLLLPDILTYDTSTAAAGPLNGRALADDVIDVELGIVTNGVVPSDGIGPHTDYRAAFPYLGVPNGAYPVPEVSDADIFSADLSGSEEVPAVESDAKGVATFANGSLEFLVVTMGLENVTQSHIHVGDAGENGPVAAFLFGPSPGTTQDGILAEGIHEDDSDLVVGTLDDLIDVLRGGYAYVNVHTTGVPSGEIRGQIGPIDLDDSPGGAFDDDNGNVHEGAIEALAAAGVTNGTTATTFSPNALLTRGQIASLIDRALNLPDTAVDSFGDDDGNTHEAAINRLAAAGIANGTGPGTYEPNAPVTRGQLASLIDRALNLPDTAVDSFGDDNGNTHEAAINRLAAAGIVNGTGPGTYEPNTPVTRGQAASIIARALGWVS